jgi:hypothetical protein
MLMMTWLACTSTPPSAPPPAPVALPEGEAAIYAAANAFNATRPRFEQPLGDGRTPVPGLPDLSAGTCQGCHPETHAEWTTSIHAVAWIDPQFQAEITKSGNRWLCMNCHTPLQIQQEKLAIGLHDGDVERPILVDNPAYDVSLRDEGITCAACHVRDGVVRGPGLGGNAPHPVEADPAYRDGSLCLRCHQAEATYPGKNFVCTFNTGAEWRAGPYAAEGTTCGDCHMPSIQRPAAVGGPVRTVGRHWWRGAGIPKIPGRYPPPEANAFGLETAARVADGRLIIEATNAHAGHMLPSGDPERRVHVDARFVGADGRELGAKRWTFGQFWTWDPPTKQRDDRLAPRETRTLTHPLPPGTVRVELATTNERMSQENADYHHLEDYPVAVTFDRKTVAVDPSRGGVPTER